MRVDRDDQPGADVVLSGGGSVMDVQTEADRIASDPRILFGKPLDAGRARSDHAMALGLSPMRFSTPDGTTS
jgi:hypothetical protein